MSELSDAASWALLSGRNFGHLGLSEDNMPEIYPVNYSVDGHSIVFRTAEGSKLREITHNRHVVFEVDAETEDGVWSVVVKGRALDLDVDPILTDHVLAALPPWTPTEPFVYVRITPDSLRGRQFEHHLPIGRS
ncbi:MAG: pyridoxamine 5'-phosphate oxidase family protein [Rhodoglobus sp.]